MAWGWWRRQTLGGETPSARQRSDDGGRVVAQPHQIWMAVTAAIVTTCEPTGSGTRARRSFFTAFHAKARGSAVAPFHSAHTAAEAASGSPRCMSGSEGMITSAAPLPSAVCWELATAAVLLPLLQLGLHSPVCPEVLASDASPWGFGVVAAEPAPELVADALRFAGGLRKTASQGAIQFAAVEHHAHETGIVSCGGQQAAAAHLEFGLGFQRNAQRTIAGVPVHMLELRRGVNERL